MILPSPRSPGSFVVRALARSLGSSTTSTSFSSSSASAVPVSPPPAPPTAAQSTTAFNASLKSSGLATSQDLASGAAHVDTILPVSTSASSLPDQPTSVLSSLHRFKKQNKNIWYEVIRPRDQLAGRHFVGTVKGPGGPAAGIDMASLPLRLAVHQALKEAFKEEIVESIKFRAKPGQPLVTSPEFSLALAHSPNTPAPVEGHRLEGSVPGSLLRQRVGGPALASLLEAVTPAGSKFPLLERTQSSIQTAADAMENDAPFARKFILELSPDLEWEPRSDYAPGRTLEAAYTDAPLQPELQQVRAAEERLLNDWPSSFDGFAGGLAPAKKALESRLSHSRMIPSSA